MIVYSKTIVSRWILEFDIVDGPRLYISKTPKPKRWLHS